MKRFITAITLSLALAIGSTACAHQQLTDQQVARTAVHVGAVAGLVTLMVLAAQNPPPPSATAAR